MKTLRRLIVSVMVTGFAAATIFGNRAEAQPPFGGTIFIDPDIITASDKSTFVSAPYAGMGERWMFDRRVNGWIYVNAFLFDAIFSDGLAAEIQVNPEFGTEGAAAVEAEKYGAAIGRLPTVLRSEMETVWIHLGIQPFGGGNNNILIHTGQALLYEADGILEETLVHEASHTSLDATHASAPGWLAAQTADGEFISTYAQDFPLQEDVAESFLPYLAVRYRSERISPALESTISTTIPNRIAYFDNEVFDLWGFCTAFDDDLELMGLTVTGIDVLEACFTITTSTVVVQDGGSLTLRARDVVALGNGMEVQTGGALRLLLATP